MSPTNSGGKTIPVRFSFPQKHTVRRRITEAYAAFCWQQKPRRVVGDDGEWIAILTTSLWLCQGAKMLWPLTSQNLDAAMREFCQVA